MPEQATATTPTPQAAPPPLPTPALPVTPAPYSPSPFEYQPGQPTRPITRPEIQVIRNQRGEMSSQLSSAQNRRERLLGEIRSAPSGTEQGLLQQLQVLNDRIVRIERDIEISGQTLRTGQVPVGITIVPPPFTSPSDEIARGSPVRCRRCDRGRTPRGARDRSRSPPSDRTPRRPCRSRGTNGRRSAVLDMVE